ncbi:MAG: gamma-glutamyltransferase [Dongiaceae bacterium]
MRDLQLPGRSPALAPDVMAATPNPLATAAALDILRRGGNALDAAVAAAAVLAVVEPHQTGIGGDCFVIMAPRGEDRLIGYNGSGRAPAAATPDWYRAHGIAAITERSPHAVTVPGAIDAWTRLVADHGTMEMAALLAPAIRYAEDGFPVHAQAEDNWAGSVAHLAADPDSARLFLPGGRPLRMGEVHRNPALAETLRTIAREGRAGFYQGRVAADMVRALKARGGLHELADFAAAAGEYVTPIRTSYRGVEVCQIPPNNQGITALLMLNILQAFDLGSLAPLSAERLHLEIEAGRLAYRDRDAFVADQRFAAVPVEELLAPGYAAALAATIDPARAAVALPRPLRTRSDTIYLTVVDRDRNAVSLINSVYKAFGSGIVATGSGVVLHNRGLSFRLDPEHPNCIGPGKRPLHTIMPGMAVRDGRVLYSYGVMGGHYQPFGHVHLLTNLIDHGLDPQAGLDLARVFHDGAAVEAERGVPAASVEGLAARGHRVIPADGALGGGQCIAIDWQRGVLTGGSDPRMDGAALGF